jgi:DNA polymerase III sliding clamp (beta) subunit (PCNA family)
MIRVNASLFRIAFKCTSTEASRYYLNGVFIEKHPTLQGVTMTATDGHKLISIYDESGTADAPAIVQLTKKALDRDRLQPGSWRARP